MKKWLLLIFGFGLATFVLLLVVNMMFGARVSRVDYGGSYESGGPAVGMAPLQKESFIGSVGEVLSPSLGAPSSRSTYYSRPTVAPMPTDDALEVDERVYRKSSRYDVVVKELADYMQQIKEFVLSIDGRVLSSSMQASGKIAYGQMFIKVPVAKFEETNLRIVTGVDEVVSEQVSAEDETGKVVSLEEQIADLEAQLLEKQIELGQETDEAKRRRLEAEIKRLEQQIASLKTRMEGVEATVEYASVGLRAANTIEYFDPSGERPVDLWDEIKEAWSSVFAILLVLARALIWIVIYGVLWLPIILIVKFASGKLKKPKAESSEEGKK